MTERERRVVSRVKLSQYNGGDSLPAVHIGLEPDATTQDALLIHVQAYQMLDASAVAVMLRTVADALDEDTQGTPAEDTPGHTPFNPQPREPGGR